MSINRNKRRRTSDPADDHTADRSVAQSQSFSDAMLSHPILLQTLKAQEILQLKRVCKAWQNWYYSDGTRAIRGARNQDGTLDWYFPVFVNKTSPQPDGKNSWSWYGIWHERAHELKVVHSFLPPLFHLPAPWTTSSNNIEGRRTFSNNDIVAGAGGLLLIKTLPCVFPVRRSARLNSQGAGTSNRSYHLSRHAVAYDWEPLMVVNPLTKEFREIPVANVCVEANVNTSNLFLGVLVHMVVDELSATYRIILTFRKFVCLYNSSSNSWRISRFTEPGPWGRHPALDSHWAHHVCGSVYWRGRLLFADMELGRVPVEVRPNRLLLRLRVLEVDFERGEWKFHMIRNIPVKIWRDNFEHCLGRDITFAILSLGDSARMSSLPYLELVECNEEIFAVVPARLDRCLEVGAAIIQRARPHYYELVRHHFDPELEYMPLQFYIFQLQGPSLLHGALRIRLPRSRTDLRSRWDALAGVPLQDHPPNRHWMSCHASGNLIWVSCEDYLLQYDVATGQSKTQIIPVNENDHKLKVSYRPSFHMKP